MSDAYYYHSLEIENVRCFKKKQTLQLDEAGRPAQWTILVGENGVGKTTLLECLAALQPVVTVKSERERILGSVFSTRLDFRLFASAHSSIRSYWSRSAVGAGQSLPPEAALAIWRDRSIQMSYGLLGSIKDPGQIDVRCYSYGASRSVGKATLIAEPGIFDRVDPFIDDPVLINPEEWLLQADYAKSKGGEREASRLQQIADTLKELLPGVHEIAIETRTGQTGPRAWFRTDYGWVLYEHLSLGCKSSITWIVDLAVRMFHRYEKSDQPLQQPAIALIDEIDLHLHPRWQRGLFETLTRTFPRTQFIATTHSPLVVQAAPNANIVVLKNAGDHVVIDRAPESVRQWRVDQILTSEIFDLPSARPPRLDNLYRERDRILSRSRVTQEQRHRLVEIEQEISNQPGGESPSDMQARDIIREASRILRRANGA